MIRLDFLKAQVTAIAQTCASRGEKHNITPQTIFKSRKEIIEGASILDIRKSGASKGDYAMSDYNIESMVADTGDAEYLSKKNLETKILEFRKAMNKASKQTDFMEAARLRDEMFRLEKIFKERFSN